MTSINGWKQVSEKVWEGNGDNKIQLKIMKSEIAVKLYTKEYGHESDKVKTMSEALKSVEWFMNRRSQN